MTVLSLSEATKIFHYWVVYAHFTAILHFNWCVGLQTSVHIWFFGSFDGTTCGCCISFLFKMLLESSFYLLLAFGFGTTSVFFSAGKLRNLLFSTSCGKQGYSSCSLSSERFWSEEYFLMCYFAYDFFGNRCMKATWFKDEFCRRYLYRGWTEQSLLPACDKS
jgi:hypothetical protein